jgi:hypothetical protein
MNESEILRTLDRIWERSNVRTTIYGRLGKEGGTVEDIEVRGRPGYVYVSVGDLGDQGLNIAKDKVGVARTIFQQVKMRRELGELVIYEASAYQGGTGTGDVGTGGGVTSFFALDEVDPNDWDNGEVPTWDVASGTFKPMTPGEGGAGGGSYLPGDGIIFAGNVIQAKANTDRGIIVDSTGIGVFASINGGIESDFVTHTGLRLNLHSTASGLSVDSTGLRVGAGDGIAISGSTVTVNVPQIYNPMAGLTHVSGDLEVKLGTNSGLEFGSGGGLLFGDGDGLLSTGNVTNVVVDDLMGQGLVNDGSNNFKVLFSEYPPAGMGYGNYDGIYVGEGKGILVYPDHIEVKLSTIELDGMQFDAEGGLFIGDGDGINVSEGAVAVDVVELISPLVYGIGHDGLNNFVVELEPNSGLRYNDPSGKLELGTPGDLTVHSESILIDDTHYHHVATSSNPGPNEQIMATDIYGGFIFDTNLLTVDAANDRIGINTFPENLSGAAALDVLVDNLDDITQRLRQKQDQRGRIWRVEDYTGQELIVLDSVGDLQSGNPGFVSGMTGWQISHTGNAEFNNIWARGELHATVFVKDEIHATGGTFMVATAATFYEDCIITDVGVGIDSFWVDNNSIVPDGEGPLQIVSTSANFLGTELTIETAGNVIKLNHPPSGPATYFQQGEILRVKTEINEVDNPLRLADVWLVVNQGDVHDDYGSYSVDKVSGSDCTIPKGTAIVTYGQVGDGAILMTSDWRPASNDDGYAPYIDIFTTGEAPWTGELGSIIPHVRLGQLKGVGLPGVSGINRFGMIAGSDLSDAASGYLIASGEGVELYKGLIRVHNGANLTGQWDQNGNFKLGKNVGQSATTGFEVITTAGHDDEGDVYIGDREGTHYLHWDQSNGTLLVTGSLQVGGGGGYATTVYVDEAMDDAVTEANLYTDGEIGGILGANNVYTDSRRLVAVDGTWSSTAYNKVKWVSAKAYFANQTSRTITNSIAGDLTVAVGRTYLYVNLDQVGNLTIIPVTSAATLIQPSYVVIAVVDVGTSTASTARAAINIIVGSTYITGANIFTGSILASNIAANAIDTGWLAAGAVTANEIDVNTLSTINGTKIQRIEGVLLSAARIAGQAATNLVSWGGVGNTLRVTLANGVVITVTASSRTITGLEYAYVLNRTSNATVALLWYDPLEPAIDTLPSNAVVIAVCQSGPEAATAVMVNGGVIISGSNIIADSITATQIKARSITAGLIALDTITSAELNDSVFTDVEDNATNAAIASLDLETIVGISGKISADGTVPTPVLGRFSWPALTVRYKTGRTSSITTVGSPYDMVATASTARVYFSINPQLSSTAMVMDETLSGVPAGNIIIAVGERQTTASSVAMVYGGVVISGNSIVAGSITATQINGGTITADKVDSNFFTSSQDIAAGQATAEIYKNTIVSCSGALVADPNTNGKITWPAMTIRFANNSTRVVPASTATVFHNIDTVGARGYFWVVPGEPAATTLHGTTTSTAVPNDGVIIGVAERGETHTSVTMTYGGTIISGNHIMTGSITAGEISAGAIDTLQLAAFAVTAGKIEADAVTADKINVVNLEAVKALTGNLTVNGYLNVSGSAAKIYSSTKTTFGSAVAGFFMGWDTVGADAYKFALGDANNYFKWTGTGFDTRWEDAFKIVPSGPNGECFYIEHPSSSARYVSIGALWNYKGLDWLRVLPNLYVDNAYCSFLESVEITLATTAPANFTAMRFESANGSYGNTLDYQGASGTLVFNGTLTAGVSMIAGSMINSGNTFRIAGSRTPPSRTSSGNVGEICWNGTYLYICTATNFWSKILLEPL